MSAHQSIPYGKGPKKTFRCVECGYSKRSVFRGKIYGTCKECGQGFLVCTSKSGK